MFYMVIFNVGKAMTGYELRLWRSGQYWSRYAHWRHEDAAEQLGVSLRSYVSYEKNGPPHMVVLGIKTLSLRLMLPELEKLSVPHVITRLRILAGVSDVAKSNVSKDEIQMPFYGLKPWRTSLGWTQKETAEKLKVCLRTYRDYERNTVPRTVMLAIQALTLAEMLPHLSLCRREMLFQTLHLILAIEAVC
ncbi:helix-turn-helix domain-containing protein (plasmid) [Xenorhabdus stockiae]|uniref:helix-turn-helix domain-containing protein n=1 Tax=Xenorhabdus stockiae TaxID=351614 RepID=UPI003CEA30F1